ncbi:MAG TPA: alpha/beta fold hydrolase [Myxococcota bacterium]|jgi:pimeloyl-ACP methyl ester carboxylesterase
MSAAEPSSSPRARRALLLALEAPRALFEAGSLAPALPWLANAPRGDGHAVLVLPGYLASDVSTRILRAFLRDRGYATHGWGLGRNRGPNASLLGALRARLTALSGGGRVSLVGWSLGGVFARELAKAEPERVRTVITLGSPFGARAEHRAAPPVPATAIYSKSDGIVPWESCRELPGARTENIELVGSHCGLGVHPLALFAIADRLAQPERAWKPFDRSRWRGALYA